MARATVPDKVHCSLEDPILVSFKNSPLFNLAIHFIKNHGSFIGKMSGELTSAKRPYIIAVLKAEASPCPSLRSRSLGSLERDFQNSKLLIIQKRPNVVLPGNFIAVFVRLKQHLDLLAGRFHVVVSAK